MRAEDSSGGENPRLTVEQIKAAFLTQFPLNNCTWPAFKYHLLEQAKKENKP